MQAPAFQKFWLILKSLICHPVYLLKVKIKKYVVHFDFLLKNMFQP
jgi:hypothetical protein